MTDRQKLFVGVTTLVFVLGVVIYGNLKASWQAAEVAQNINLPEFDGHISAA